MATFILTWRPAQWAWSDLTHCAELAHTGKEFASEWSTGRRKTMVPGDNVYFLRQLTDPVGIFGHGIILTKPALRDRLDDKTKEEYRVEVRVKTLLDPTRMLPLDISALPHPLDALWKARETGERVHPQGSERLRSLWQAHWTARAPHGLTIVEPTAPYAVRKLLRMLG